MLEERELSGGCIDSRENPAITEMILRAWNLGEIVAIKSVSALGVEWLSSSGSGWFMQWPSIYSLFPGWNGTATVNWAFEVTLDDGRELMVTVEVTPPFMQQLMDIYFERFGYAQ